MQTMAQLEMILFLLISTMPSSAHAVYFYFSLLFLLSRSTAVLLFVSAINDQAREPLRLLRLVPLKGYHPEVFRFAAELASDQVALTGLKFFNVTRKLFLAVRYSTLSPYLRISMSATYKHIF